MKRKTCATAFCFLLTLGGSARATTISVGYTYSVTNAEFESIVAPAFAVIPDSDGYIISVGLTSFDIHPGEDLSFADFGLSGVQAFDLTGIDQSLALDPNNALAFPLGVSLQNVSGPFQISQDPITVTIPEPTTPILACAGMFLPFAFRRRKMVGK